jgi:hypothetical protein
MTRYGVRRHSPCHPSPPGLAYDQRLVDIDQLLGARSIQMKKVLLLGLIAALAGCATPPPALPTVKLEFRPASFSPAPGLTEATIKGSDRKVYISGKVLLSNPDVASARVATSPNGPNVELKFTDDGARKFAAVTEQNLMKPIAIVVDGDVLCAPTVREKIVAGRAVISGAFSMVEARRIADGIRGQKAERR